MVKPARLIKRLYSSIYSNSSAIDIKVRPYGDGAQTDLYLLNAVPMATGDFDGVVLQAERLLSSKKVGIWTSKSAFAAVQTHALERLVERGQADKLMLREAVALIGLTSQAFNSAHVLGMNPKMPLLLPFHDGLLVGQSDLLSGLPPELTMEFGKHGRVQKQLLQVNVATLLGNPPRTMRIRTFINTLRGRKERSHELLSAFFATHNATLRDFSRRALFGFSREDTAHAISREWPRVVAQLTNQAPQADGVVAESQDPLEGAFRDEGERTRFRRMLEEYQSLLREPAVAAVLDQAETHVR